MVLQHIAVSLALISITLVELASPYPALNPNSSPINALIFGQTAAPDHSVAENGNFYGSYDNIQQDVARSRHLKPIADTAKESEKRAYNDGNNIANNLFKVGLGASEGISGAISRANYAPAREGQYAFSRQIAKSLYGILTLLGERLTGLAR